ncbi:sugar phosphate isomerase/epimerase family protein [Rhizobium terricola]|uniref:sugar phosphate isomerase/epimerase family protein n=1 Tax=Rhizobium terricola TaxID=2728849 RepID=UPI00197F2378|nr:sugar phosphate isomerase/epimerase [Rhizobium terricola]
MSRLLVLQSLWTFEALRHPPLGIETLHGRLALASASGFDGIGTLWLEREAAREVARPARALGLAIEGTALPDSIDALKPALEWGTEFGLHHLNIQPDIRPTEVSEACRILEGWQRLAEQVDFPIYVETHRGRMTNDLLFTLKLLDGLPRLRLTADLSHYVVGREILLPVAGETEAQMRRILDHAEAFHGRVASAEQIQLDIGFSCNRDWLKQFESWWRYGFHAWQNRHGEGDELTFLCELGAAPYAITGPDGIDIGNRWKDSLELMRIARQIWSECAANTVTQPDLGGSQQSWLG